MSIRLLPVALAGLLALGTSALAQPLRVPASAPSATALDRYVATPDPAYKWAVVGTRQEGHADRHHARDDVADVAVG